MTPPSGCKIDVVSKGFPEVDPEPAIWLGFLRTEFNMPPPFSINGRGLLKGQNISKPSFLILQAIAHRAIGLLRVLTERQQALNESVI